MKKINYERLKVLERESIDDHSEYTGSRSFTILTDMINHYMFNIELDGQNGGSLIENTLIDLGIVVVTEEDNFNVPPHKMVG